NGLVVCHSPGGHEPDSSTLSLLVLF
ncbi:hypothetical protein pipiens_000979, partial [Culex pipiens pipiens]